MKVRLLACGLMTAALAVFVACGTDSSPSEPTPTCTYTISPASATIPSNGGNGTINVTTAAGCAWTAAASAGWISITAPANGTGPGSVTYSVTSNAAAAARNGTVTIGGQTHAINQEGRAPTACTYELSPASADFTKDGGSGTVTVSAPGECSWTASSGAGWVTIDRGAQGTGSGTVSYTVSRQFEIPGRTATLTIAGRSFTVRQSGDLGSCKYSVAPVSFTPCMPGGTVTATIATEPTCPWTAAPAASWLGVPSGTSGTGSATISIAYSDNYDAPRSGMVEVRWPTPTAGQNIQVAQAGCRYGVSRAAIDIPAAGGSASFDVLQQSEPLTCGGATQDRCVWTARSEVSWITITSSMPRSGDNPVAFSVAPNDGPSARTGRIVVRDKVVTITQAGGPVR
ncbi:MAG TPA: BACON domain-containing carbohydrate-binding protein [Vicinamibacterales bacterium]|nr:BACON domain-containing carbohydrate-binding protein [Vicinamibacterales bacterium]